MDIAEPTVASTGLGSKPYPSNLRRMFNKYLTRFEQSLSEQSTPKSSKRKKDAADRVKHLRKLVRGVGTYSNKKRGIFGLSSVVLVSVTPITLNLVLKFV